MVLPLLRPPLGTVLLLTTVATWNSFILVVPLVAAFLSLQKYWQGGLSLGSVR